MITDFFESCIPSLQSEIEDYNNILREIAHNTDAFVAFLPMIIEDFWPVSVLESTAAREFNQHSGSSLYIIPFGSHDFWGIYGLNDTIQKWYDEDDISVCEKDGLEVEETILLKSRDFQMEKTVNVKDVYSNAVYLKLSTKDARSIHAIILMDTPHCVWKSCIEKYNISTDVLIDSNKGMGDWFYAVPLYDVMKNTTNLDLLPQYYFSGKYARPGMPDGFEEIYMIPEAKDKNWGECAIFKTNWKR